jgi:NTP pyrophosphatase (non-canonical NTP hydrolase)
MIPISERRRQSQRELQMELNNYQQRATESDQRPGQEGEALLIPLLGLAGEAGSLLSEYKKRIRDREGYPLFKERIKEELGDILWYLSNLTTKAGLSLEDVAAANLDKIRGRWLETFTEPRFFDDAFPVSERLPRHFEVSFGYDKSGGRSKVIVRRGGQQVGNLLTDNSYDEDGYRFHDAYHFTFAALLAWSPVTRRNLKLKRKSVPLVDEVEDGGRGWVIEEAIAALAFAYANEHGFFEHTDRVDESLLRVIRTLTQTAEVRARSEKEWERTIAVSSRLFKQLRDHEGGTLRGDLEERSIIYLSSEAGTG